MLERLSVALVVTSEGRRWLIAYAVHRPTSSLIEEVFSVDEGVGTRVAGYVSDDIDTRQRFWGERVITSHRPLSDVPAGLPLPTLPDTLRRRSPSHDDRDRVWFRAKGT
jgi:hypothetical protein